MAWYNTYRPQKFNDVIGQDLVKTVLINALQFNIIKHAYLFSGPKGTGKTTLARIFANSLNQTDLFPEARLDIIELDAASNTGVDDVRQLIENSNVPPISGKFKVYIIDEVHMLSKQAMNALLKTLEEPPAYLVFLLATTNPEKLLPTVLSRLTKLNLSSHSISNIANQLRYIAGNQKMTIDDASLILIAKRSNGGQRDAINLLETLHSYNLVEHNLKSTSDLLGLLPEELLEQVSIELLSKTLNPSTLEQITSFNLDGDTFLGQLLDWTLEKSLNNDTSFDKLVIPLSEVASMKLPITNPLHSLAIVQVKLSDQPAITFDNKPSKQAQITVTKEEVKKESKPEIKPNTELEIKPEIQTKTHIEESSLQPIEQPQIQEEASIDAVTKTSPKDSSQNINQFLISLKLNTDCPMTLRIMLTDLGVESIVENKIVLSISNGVFMTQIKSTKNLEYLKLKLKEFTSQDFEISIIQRDKKDLPNYQLNLSATPANNRGDTAIANNIPQDLPEDYYSELENSTNPDQANNIEEIENFEPNQMSNQINDKVFYEAYNKLAPNMENKGVKVFKGPIPAPQIITDPNQPITNNYSNNNPNNIDNESWKSTISDFDLE